MNFSAVARATHGELHVVDPRTERECVGRYNTWTFLQDGLCGFAALFADSSEPIRFYFLVFVFPRFLVVGPVR